VAKITSFASQITRDLDRIAQSSLSVDATGLEPPLSTQHEQVLEKLYERDVTSADKLYRAILSATGGVSPRANYNQACICSWLAEIDNYGREELLLQAKRNFEKAVEYGIVCLISLRSKGPVRPTAVIKENPALALLFQRYQDLQNIVDDDQYFGPKRLGGGV